MRDHSIITTAPTTLSSAAILESARQQHLHLSDKRKLRPVAPIEKISILTAVTKQNPMLAPELHEQACTTMGYRFHNEDQCCVHTFKLPDAFCDASANPLTTATVIHSAIMAVYYDKEEEIEFQNAGATFTGAVVTPQGIFAFNAGDGATFLITIESSSDKNSHHVWPLTRIHTGERCPAECQRVTRTGGKIGRSEGSSSLRLADGAGTIPLRGVGDLKFRNEGMTHHPDLSYLPHAIEANTLHFLLSVSDGVLDQMGALQIQEWLDKTQFSPATLTTELPKALIEEVIVQAHTRFKKKYLKDHAMELPTEEKIAAAHDASRKPYLENCTAVLTPVNPDSSSAQGTAVADGHGEKGHVPAIWALRYFTKNLSLFFNRAEAFFHSFPKITTDETLAAPIQIIVGSLKSLLLSLKFMLHVLTPSSKEMAFPIILSFEKQILEFSEETFPNCECAFEAYLALQRASHQLDSIMSPLFQTELSLGLASLCEAKIAEKTPISHHDRLLQKALLLSFGPDWPVADVEKTLLEIYVEYRASLLLNEYHHPDEDLNVSLRFVRDQHESFFRNLRSLHTNACLPLLISSEETLESFQKKHTSPYYFLMDLFFEEKFFTEIEPQNILAANQIKKAWLALFFKFAAEKGLHPNTPFHDEGAYEIFFECFQNSNHISKEVMHHALCFYAETDFVAIARFFLILEWNDFTRHFLVNACPHENTQHVLVFLMKIKSKGFQFALEKCVSDNEPGIPVCQLNTIKITEEILSHIATRLGNDEHETNNTVILTEYFKKELPEEGTENALGMRGPLF